MTEKHPETCRHVEQVPELGTGGPGEMGSRRLRLRAVDSRGRALAGFMEIWSPGRRRPLRLHRVGGQATLVQRQGGAERDLLLCDEPVVRASLQPPTGGMCVWEGRPTCTDMGIMGIYTSSAILVPGHRRAQAARPGKRDFRSRINARCTGPRRSQRRTGETTAATTAGSPRSSTN